MRSKTHVYYEMDTHGGTNELWITHSLSYTHESFAISSPPDVLSNKLSYLAIL